MCLLPGLPRPAALPALGSLKGLCLIPGCVSFLGPQPEELGRTVDVLPLLGLHGVSL